MTRLRAPGRGCPPLSSRRADPRSPGPCCVEPGSFPLCSAASDRAPVPLGAPVPASHPARLPLPRVAACPGSGEAHGGRSRPPRPRRLGPRPGPHRRARAGASPRPPAPSACGRRPRPGEAHRGWPGCGFLDGGCLSLWPSRRRLVRPRRPYPACLSAESGRASPHTPAPGLASSRRPTGGSPMWDKGVGADREVGSEVAPGRPGGGGRLRCSGRGPWLPSAERIVALSGVADGQGSARCRTGG